MEQRVFAAGDEPGRQTVLDMTAQATKVLSQVYQELLGGCMVGGCTPPAAAL